MLKLSKVTSPSHRVARTLHPTWEDSASTSEVQEFFSVSTFQVPNPSFLPERCHSRIPLQCRRVRAVGCPPARRARRLEGGGRKGNGAEEQVGRRRKKERKEERRRVGERRYSSCRPTRDRDALLQRLRRDCNLPDRRMPHRKWIRGQHWAAQASLQPSAALCSISNRASCGRAEYSIVEMGKRRSRMSKKGCLKIGRRAGFFVRIV